jgi:hypothetical protein
VTNLRSWRTKWNDAAIRRIATLPESSPPRTWPLLGMLALGLVAGAALGGYAASQRSQMKRLAMYAHHVGDELAGMGEPEVKPVAVTSTPSNHRRKATSEV